MRTIVQMAHRSDRREAKPSAHWGSKARAHDWLLARDFHFGQEDRSPLGPTPLHTQAGDTTARLTYRAHGRRAHREGWNQHRIRGPSLKTQAHRWNLQHKPSAIAPSGDHGARACQGFPRFARRLHRPGHALRSVVIASMGDGRTGPPAGAPGTGVHPVERGERCRVTQARALRRILHRQYSAKEEKPP